MATALKLTRVLETGCVGKDVEGVTRAMLRYLGDDAGWRSFVAALPAVRRTWGTGKTTLAKRCQAKAGIAQSGVFGTTSEGKLRQAGAFDAVADLLLDEYAASKTDPALEKAREMLAFCRLFDGPYGFGSQHDGSFANDDVHDAFDCSSSTSFALWKFGLLGADRAQVSGWFERWGEPGRGELVTVHANDDHVWIEFSLPEGYFRFDTSPHGDGERGPRVRTRKRFDSTFVHRHPAGL